MKDTKYIKDNAKKNIKNPRNYYDNYKVNIQEIFNKNFDKANGKLVNSKNSKHSNIGFGKQLKTETNSIIYTKLGNILS